MQTERVTFLTTAERKATQVTRAAKQDISIGEYVRRKVEGETAPSAEEDAMLNLLVNELNEALPDMHKSLDSMWKSVTESRNLLRETRAYFDA